MDMVVADLSFISATRAVPVLTGEVAVPGAPLVVLVKPQFEAGRVEASRGKGVIRDPAVNHQVRLPIADREIVVAGHTRDQILADPRLRMLCTSYIFQAGQPESVREAFSQAMGLQAQEFTGLDNNLVRQPVPVTGQSS